MPKTPKRPRDLNQWAKRMVDIATGEADNRLSKGDNANVIDVRDFLSRRRRALDVG
jgi:hypothetical protein